MLDLEYFLNPPAKICPIGMPALRQIVGLKSEAWGQNVTARSRHYNCHVPDSNFICLKYASHVANRDKHEMAPDRGPVERQSSRDSLQSSASDHTSEHSRAESILAERASDGQNFTLRSLVLGLLIGVVICFSNTYFGLQTGWISGMSMPSALIGFAWFKLVSRYIKYPFTPVENVLVQTVAGSVGTMPLGCGFVGVIPALEFLLNSTETPDGSRGLSLPLGKLIVWALGICFFGVFFAVPLRKEVIIREKLKFPSGTATALMISVLHGGEKDAGIVDMNNDSNRQTGEEERRLISSDVSDNQNMRHDQSGLEPDEEDLDKDNRGDWKARIRLLTISFGVSALYVRIFLGFSEPFIAFQGRANKIAYIAISDPRLVLHSPYT